MSDLSANWRFQSRMVAVIQVPPSTVIQPVSCPFHTHANIGLLQANLRAWMLNHSEFGHRDLDHFDLWTPQVSVFHRPGSSTRVSSCAMYCRSANLKFMHSRLLGCPSLIIAIYPCLIIDQHVWAPIRGSHSTYSGGRLFEIQTTAHWLKVWFLIWNQRRDCRRCSLYWAGRYGNTFLDCCSVSTLLYQTRAQTFGCACRLNWVL